jgi:tRNA 5-methylaminomethyl-2-thiouridine biosynthesis bifunctional protein
MPALVPARLGFLEGVPYSETFGDVYHSAAGGIEQARHVFLQGNAVQERWAGRERFVILEAGFGLGLNFLATWQAWKRDSRRCARLHYVAVEKHPFSLEDLRTLHEAFPELKDEAAQLHAAWPPLVSGAHRAELEPGQVVLTLFFDDIKLLRELRLQADAIYLDGFSPAKNPEMWSAQTLRAVSRLAAPGATAATWSVAASVRTALEQTGFEVEKRPGFASKKEMLVCRSRKSSGQPEPSRGKTAIVVGAGLAGAAMCERLCSRGWNVTLVERHASPAQEGSGNLAGAFHPIVTPDDSVFARLTRAAFLLSLRKFSSLDALRWDPCGALQLARNEKEAASQRAAVSALGLPAEYAQLVSREEASAHAGVEVAAGGLWFPQAGWIQPRSLVDALLAACGPRLQRRFSSPFEEKDFPKSSIVILATADDALRKVAHARLRRVRGQITYVPEDCFEPPHAVVLRGGMVLPAVEGRCAVGASFDIDLHDPSPRAESEAGNLERLASILPGVSLKQGAFENRVAFRAVAPDRLPLAGPIDGSLWGVLALGSRGLIWSALAAELVACQLEGEPLPVEGTLADALDPGRFARRRNRGQLPISTNAEKIRQLRGNR